MTVVEAGRTAISARGVHKHYALEGGGGHVVHAVDNVDLELRSGEIHALVGESGSGKTTVAHLLAGLIEPTSGTIDPPASRTRRERAQHAQIVFQDPFGSLNPLHTVEYHLDRALHLHNPGTRRAERYARSLALLEQVRLLPAEDFIGRLPTELSGGQRQRVVIARSLAVDPRILLCDEPTSMLDVSIRIDVLNLLSSLARDRDMALLYISHDIAGARYVADDITVMYAGQVVESGPATAVVDAPAHPYSSLLVAASPDPDRKIVELPVLGDMSEPPDLVDPGPGCRFRARCPFAMAVCAVDVPLVHTHDRVVRCWLHVDEASRPDVVDSDALDTAAAWSTGG